MISDRNLWYDSVVNENVAKKNLIHFWIKNVEPLNLPPPPISISSSQFSEEKSES